MKGKRNSYRYGLFGSLWSREKWLKILSLSPLVLFVVGRQRRWITGPGGCSKRASRARSSTPSLYFALSDRATHRAAFIGQANIAKRFLSNGRIPFGTNDDPDGETYPYRGGGDWIRAPDFSLFPRCCLCPSYPTRISDACNILIERPTSKRALFLPSRLFLSLLFSSLSAREISVTGKLMRGQGCN